MPVGKSKPCRRRSVIVPYGLKTWLECLAMAVAKECPKCMRRFIAKYCQELMEYRNENPMMDIRDLVLTYQSLRENRRSLKKHYHVDGQYSQFKCFSWCTTLSSCDAHNVQAEIQRTERTDDMGQSVAIETSTASKDLISCHSEDVSKAIGLYMSQPGKENEQGPSATTSEAIPDVVVHNKAPALVPTPNLSRAPSGDLQDGNVVEKELGCQATDRLTYQQSTDISRSPSEELLSEYEQLSDGEFEIGAQHVSAIAVRYLSETMMEYEQFSEGGFGIATQKISDVSLQEITSSEERMSDESYGSPKLSPMSSSESAVRVASPLQTVEFHHLRDNKHEIDVRASAEQLDLTSSCMLYRSSYDSLSEEEESAESATILERSHSEAVLRTISLEERLNRQEERSKEETYFSGVTDETLLDDGEEDADLVVLYEAPSDECVVSSENSEISADVCGDLSPTQEGASVSVHSSFMVTKGSVVMGTTPSVRCLTLSPVSSDVKKEVCASGNNLSSIPPSAVMELPDVSGDVNIPREEDMTSQHVATEIKRHIPLRPSSESINFASSWDQARLHSSSKPRVKDLSRLSSLTRQSNRTTLNEKEGSASGFTEDHLSTMAHTESSITVLFENSDEDVDDESESLAVAESLAEYHSIPEVVIVHKAPSFEELPETDEEDLHRSESSVGRPDSLSGAQGSQSSVTSPTMSVGAENTDGTPYVVIIHKAPSEKDLPDTPFTPGVENMVGSGSALAEDVARLPLVHDKLPPKAPHQSEEKSSEAETAANPPAKTLYDEVVGDALKTSESLRSPRLGPTSSCILEAAKDSDTTTHVVIIHKASSGEGFPEVSITSNVESVGPQSSLKWVPSANESVTSSGTQSLNERDKSVSSVTTKSPRLTPQRSKGDVSRTTSSDRLSVSASGLNEDIYEVQLSVDTEKDSVGQSVKDSVGTANSAERLRDSSCISGALEISVSNSCVIFSSNDDDIAFENGSSTLHSDHYHSLTKSDTSAECCATLNERFNEMPVDDTLEMRTASLQQSSEGIQFSSISKDAEEADYSPNVVNISREKLPESGVTLGLLEKVPFAASKKTEDDTLDVHNSRIDTVFVGPSEAAEQRVAYVRTPSEDEISTDISVVIRSDSKLSPRHLSGDVSERVSSEHLQVSTSGLWSTPGMSAEDISEPTLSIQEVILDNTSGVVKCSSHIKLDREPSELTTTKESSTVTSSEKSVETSFDGTTEAKMASSQSSSERIQSNCILEAVEVAEIIPHVVIHKAPSGAELTETGSSCSLGHGSLSATDSLDVQKSVSGTSVVAPPESTEERVAYIRTPSQDEISGEVSVVIVRSPRVSPHHSIGDISKRASSEQLQVPNSGLASTPTVLVEDTTELLISHEDVSSEKTLDIAQCSSDSILEREEACEMATTRASPPPPTPSGQHIAEIVKSDERLKSPVLSPRSSWASEKLNEISVDGMLEVTLTSSQPSLECIQPPSMLKSADDSEMSPHMLIIQKEPSIVENPESDMTTGMLEVIPPAASKSSLDDLKHLAYDTLDVEKLGSDTAVVAPTEKEQTTIYKQILSQDEICAEVSVVRIRSPGLSPCHSSGDVSKRASTEQLQVSTSGLVSTPSVSAEDISELLISHEDVSSEKTLDIAQCSSDSILEREEPCETATTRASPPPPTPSGQHIAEMVKSDKRLKSPVLSLISSCASEKSNKISVDGMLEVTLTSSQPSLESIQPPSMLKSADDSEMSPHILIIQKEPSIVENPESDMTTGVLVRIPPAASKIAQDDVKHLAYDTLDVEKSESDTAVVASPEKEQRTVYIRIPSQDEICAEVSVVSIKSPQLSPRHSSGNVSERVSTEHLQVSTSGLVSAPTVPTSAKDVSEDTFKMQANGIGSPITSSTFSEGSFHLDPSQGFSPVRSPSAILLKTKDHLKEAKISCEEMLAQDTTKILSQEKIPSPGLSPMVSEIIGVWCDNLSEEQQDETDESLEGLFLKWPRKACVSAESLDLETETDINEVAIVEEVHQQSSKTDFAENLKNTIPAATTISATALIAPSTRIPSKDSVEVMPTLSREKITFPRLSPKSSYVLQRSSPDGHQSRCLSPLSSSVRGHSPERLESPRSSPVTEFLSSVEWATQTSRSSLPIIDKATQMSRTSLLLISQASQTSRTLLAGAKQESRPSFPSVDQETQISWTLPQGIDKRTQISRTPVTSSDQGSQMSSVNLHNQGTQMIIPQEVSVTETTVDSRKLTCQSSSAGNWDDGKQSAHDISPGGFKEAEETQKDKIWTLYHLGQKNDEGLLSTQVLSEPPFNGEAYIRNFGTGAVLLSERRRERLKPLSAPIRGRLVSASAFKPGQRPSSLGPSEVVIRPPHPPSRSSSTLPDYVLVVDTETVNLDNFFNAPGTNQVQTNPLAWMSSQF
ncbi:serine-rich adhesin for platelets-like isoform X13 [Alosa sapidissima]|uniref:serine-rich adhesin for platelets-like isoform X13 n=1 Tax=Alosa sapidissima TaxID=34773 RepID=UPI001C084AF2|nr:serine-rich adhesin for platelets-like isoform X13 [Alosa sapidissima]